MKRAEFVNLKSSRQRLHGPHLMLVFKENGSDRQRLGIAVGRHAGNAVKRNRTKRLIREAFRTNRHIFPRGSDILISAKKDCSLFKLKDIEKEIVDLISKRSNLKCAI